MHKYRINKKISTNSARSVGAIALYPPGNEQGGWYFVPLSSGRRIHCFVWNVLPVSADVIGRMHELAMIENQRKMSSNFKYEWRLDDVEIESKEEDNDGEIYVIELL